MKLAELQEKGVALYLVGPDMIRYRGSEAVLTPALIEEIRCDKAHLIQELLESDSLSALPFGGSISSLLAWASELSEQERVLEAPVSYIEVPQRKITTGRVSYYTGHYLKTIVSARHYQQHPRLSWGQWTPAWWQEREREALSALTALREAMEGLTREKVSDG